MNPRVLYAAILFGLSVTGCVKSTSEKRLGDNLAQIQELQKQLRSSQKLAQQDLDWQRASRFLVTRNLTFLQSVKRLENLEKERKRFLWRQLGPQLGAVANLNTALGEIASLAENSTGFRLLGSIRFPQPLSLYSRRYALELQYITAKLDHETLRRRLFSNLYSVFLKQEQLNNRAQEHPSLHDHKTLGQLLRSGSTPQVSSNDKIQRERNSLRLQINNLLDTPGENFNLLPQTAPKISYAKTFSRYQFGKDFGYLGLQQAAVRLESSYAQLQQINFDRIPSLTLGISLPTLYDSQNPENRPELSNIRLFGSLNDSFRFDGRNAESREDAKDRAYSIRRNLYRSLEREINALNRLKANYEDLRKKEESLLAQLGYLDQIPTAAQSSAILERVEKSDALSEQLMQNRLAQRQLDLEFWVWDEAAW